MNPNLKIRIKTAIIFAAIMLGSIFIHRYAAVALLTVIGIGCCYEYAKITTPQGSIWKSSRLYVGLISMALAAMAPTSWLVPLALVAAVYGIAGIANMYTKRRFVNHHRKGSLVAILYIGIPVGLLIRYLLLQDSYTPLTLISMFAFIWMSDSAAYLVGSQIGRRKLFPRISPNKTWEGTLGAGLFCLGLAGLFWWQIGIYGLGWWLILATVVWFWGSYGDLVESSLKRQYNVKDSGSFMPGHGGFLDRFDSFLYVIPPVILLLLQHN
jgi:phosphatidate cytidylyltransferase